MTASEHSSPASSREVINAAHEISAPFAVGLELVHRVIEDDGALPAFVPPRPQCRRRELNLS
jgi:hypothetical protein